MKLRSILLLYQTIDECVIGLLYLQLPSGVVFFSGLALYWSCTLEKNVMEFFAVVPLNLQLCVLISPIWLELMQK